MKHSLDLFADNEVSTISDIIRAAYADTLATETWSNILGMIEHVVAHDISGAVFGNVRTGRLDNKIYRNVDRRLSRWYEDHYPAIMVLATTAQARGFTVWRPSDVIGRREWEASEVRNDLLNVFGVNEPICMTCGTASHVCARLWFIRSKGASDFTEKDARVFKLLHPHFCDALRLAATQLQCEIYRTFFHQAMLPQFILDASGCIMDVNTRGKQLAEGDDGQALMVQIEAIAQDMIAKSTRMLSLDFAGQKCRFWMTAVVSPNVPTSYALAVDTAEDVRRLLRQSMNDAGCSEREAEICTMLVQGASNHEIAEKLFIAESTVKDHVTSILEKLGVSHRSGVVPKLLGF